MRPIRTRILAGGLVLVAGMAIGIVISTSLVAASTPRILASEAPLQHVPVTMQAFNDPPAADVSVTVRPATGIVIRQTGTITASTCSPGATLTSGSSSVSVDGVALTNLSTHVPLWRDLTAGSEGSDVRALETELHRLGHTVTVDGRLSQADVSAGVVVAPIRMPTSALPGPRDLQAFGRSIAVDTHGTLAKTLKSGDIEASTAFAQARAAAPDATTLTVKGNTVLREPVSVTAIPATSILVTDAGDACVFSDTTAHPVKVVGSEFGTSFAVFDHTPPRSVDSAPPADGAACS